MRSFDLNVEKARLDAKYGTLQRVELHTPDFSAAQQWPSLSKPVADVLASESESDDDAWDVQPRTDDIYLLLDMAKKVREKDDIIDLLHIRLAAAERRAHSAERAHSAQRALARAAERCAHAVDDALAMPVFSRKRARERLANIGAWVMLE